MQFAEFNMLPMAETEIGVEDDDEVADRDRILHLPCSISWPMWFQAYRESCLSRNLDPKTIAKFDCFRETIREQYPRLKIAAKTTQMRCTDCTKLREALGRTHDEGARSAIKKALGEHMAQQNAERIFYMEKQMLAQAHPEAYMSLVIDAMSLLEFPWLGTRTKATDSLRSSIQVKLTGLMDHGARQTSYFVDYDEYGGDLNEIMTILLFHIKNSVIKTGRFPAHQLWQFDNCSNNKNKSILALAGLLVALGWAEDVESGFLLVGHTHTDIDRSFSSIRRSALWKPALTIAELAAEINALRDRTQCSPVDIIELTACYDWRSLIRPFVYDIENINTAQGFKVTRDVIDGHVHIVCQARGVASREYGPKYDITGVLPDPALRIPFVVPNQKGFNEEYANRLLGNGLGLFNNHGEAFQFWSAVASGETPPELIRNGPMWEVRFLNFLNTRPSRV